MVLTGGSGCGKTTLTRLANGLIPVSYDGELAGSVRIAGKDAGSWEMDALCRRVGSVFQNPRSQFFNLDTTSEVAFGCENLGLSRAPRCTGAWTAPSPCWASSTCATATSARSRRPAPDGGHRLGVRDGPRRLRAGRAHGVARRGRHAPAGRGGRAAQAAGKTMCSWPSTGCGGSRASPTGVVMRGGRVVRDADAAASRADRRGRARAAGLRAWNAGARVAGAPRRFGPRRVGRAPPTRPSRGRPRAAGYVRRARAAGRACGWTPGTVTVARAGTARQDHAVALPGGAAPGARGQRPLPRRGAALPRPPETRLPRDAGDRLPAVQRHRARRAAGRAHARRAAACAPDGADGQADCALARFGLEDIGPRHPLSLWRAAPAAGHRRRHPAGRPRARARRAHERARLRHHGARGDEVPGARRGSVHRRSPTTTSSSAPPATRWPCSRTASCPTCCPCAAKASGASARDRHRFRARPL